MLCIQAFNNLHMLLNSGAFASMLGFVKSRPRLGALWVSSPVPKFTAIPALRLGFLLFNLIPIQLWFGPSRSATKTAIPLDLVDAGPSFPHSDKGFSCLFNSSFKFF